MTVVKIEPSATHRLPFSTDDEQGNTELEELTLAANTAELMVELGAELTDDPVSLKKETQRLKRAFDESKPLKKSRKSKPLALNTAFAAKAFLQTYGQALALDVAEARAAITNKLMEIANCGETKYELKALELLGKHSDIGIFTQRSEITINYKSPQDLEDAIKERVKRLLNADLIDVTPISENLDTELGIFSEEALENEEVPPENEEVLPE